MATLQDEEFDVRWPVPFPFPAGLLISRPKSPVKSGKKYYIFALEI
jgi:hypothetical protein